MSPGMQGFCITDHCSEITFQEIHQTMILYFLITNIWRFPGLIAMPVIIWSLHAATERLTLCIMLSILKQLRLAEMVETSRNKNIWSQNFHFLSASLADTVRKKIINVHARSASKQLCHDQRTETWFPKRQQKLQVISKFQRRDLRVQTGASINRFDKWVNTAIWALKLKPSEAIDDLWPTSSSNQRAPIGWEASFRKWNPTDMNHGINENPHEWKKTHLYIECRGNALSATARPEAIIHNETWVTVTFLPWW